MGKSRSKAMAFGDDILRVKVKGRGYVTETLPRRAKHISRLRRGFSGRSWVACAQEMDIAGAVGANGGGFDLKSPVSLSNQIDPLY